MYKVAYAQFYPEGLIVIQYEIEGIEDMITVDASISDFDKFVPKEEGNIQNEEGQYIARFDQYLNLHWLIESLDGHMMYRAVNCNNIVDELINKKLTS